jgi:hypothetical protein
MGRHCLHMREYQIKLMGPSGRVAEVYVMGAQCDACALTRARILTQSHPEFASAQVIEDGKILGEVTGASHIN